MNAGDLVSKLIPSLRPEDHGLMALSLMEEFKVSHLPVVNKGVFLGVVSDSDIIDQNEPEEPIGETLKNLPRPFVYDTQHVYELVRILSEQKLTLVAVLNQEKEYMGAVSLYDLVQHFSKMAAMNEPGAILVLEMHQLDYSLSQIAQIAESNDTRILSLYISSPNESTRIEVTLKVNRLEVGALLQTFERYNYKVLSYTQEEEQKDDLKNRFDEFMRFLNV